MSDTLATGLDYRCNGGHELSETGRTIEQPMTWCGAHATHVCSERDQARPLQWFTCAKHVRNAKAEPIEQWRARMEARR